MSTTFGVLIPSTGEYEEVARRVGSTDGAVMYFTNQLAELLPDDTKVQPLDNSAQGIYTIGDIKKAINK